MGQCVGRDTWAAERYINVVLRSTVRPVLQQLPRSVFNSYNNARLHAFRIVQHVLEANNVTMLLWPACSPDLSPIDHKAYGMSWITRSMVCPGSPGLWYVLDHQAYGMSWTTRHMECPGSPGLWYVLDHQAYVCPGSPGLWYVLDLQAYSMSWITRPIVCPGSSCSTTSTPSSQPKRTDLDPPKKMTTYPT